MERKLYEMWKVQEGSKILWKVQCPKGRLTFQRKKDAERFVNDMIRIKNYGTIKLG